MGNKKICHINLTTGNLFTEPFSRDLITKVLGGFGFNTWYLYHHLGAGHFNYNQPVCHNLVDPLGPENILMITCGLLTGSGVPASSRVHLSARSPQSGLMGSSNVGGHIGARMSSINIASIIITGRAEATSYLLVNEAGISLRQAPWLRGEDTRRTLTLLQEYHPSRYTEVLTIGIAGERMVPFACIMNGTDHAAGRTGLGAVMGSKNLKAVVVQGRSPASGTSGKKDNGAQKENIISSKEGENGQKENIISSKEGKIGQKEIVKSYIEAIRNSLPIYQDFTTLGSAGHIVPLNLSGQLGTKNYREGSMQDAHKIDGRSLKKYVKKSTGCQGCPVRCKADIRLEARRYRGFTGGRPEYETVINLGSLCGLDDPEALMYLSNLANILGLDTISTGSVIAFAMDLFDRGILTLEDTGGLELKWGDAHAMEKLMYALARREPGLGETLSLGVKAAAERIGKGSETVAYHTKGVEIYGADPRGNQAMALTYAVSLRGGDFTSVYPIPAFRYSRELALRDFGTEKSIDPLSSEGKAALIRKSLLVSAVIDSLGICKVPALSIIGKFDLENESGIVEAFTGIKLSSRDLFQIGEGIVTMEKLFNAAHGATAEDDTLPGAFMTQTLTNNCVKGQVVHGLDAMVQEFYRLMEWDERGNPQGKLLERLGKSGLFNL
ncbi:MAG: aldehyde ferredoxin oxidoreductase [Desulfamplus sp.]|nr:aldehyde ferredoxin oxidoreductase [Desulfamplus sp.]